MPVRPAPEDLWSRAREHLRQQRWADAVPLYQQLLQAQPAQVAGYLDLSTCLRHLGLIDEAVVMAKTALPHARSQGAGPGHGGDAAPDEAASVTLHLAHLYAVQRRDDDAGAVCSPLLLHPQPAVRRAAAACVARLWLNQGYPSRALEVVQPHAGPDAPAETVQLRALALFEAGDAEAACAGLHALLLRQPGLPAALSNALMFASYTARCAAWHEALAPLARSLYAEHPAAHTGIDTDCRAPARTHRLDPAAPLRVGFVSADLCAHPVGYFVASFLPHLRECGVEVLLYSNGGRADAITARLQQAAHRLVPIASMATAQAVHSIRADEPDVLVDLSGHTQGHRLDVFAARACAVQASFLGYFSTTLVPAMDWLITDEWHLPPAEDAACSERVARLPHSRFCYHAPEGTPEPSPPPSARNDGVVTFGACAHVAKLGDTCVDLWSQVLRAVPGSRLLLRWKTLVDAAVRDGLRDKFAARGVAPWRIEMQGSVRHADMMAAYADIDVVLDTHPFSGATTTCEALWMGVPVITLPADRPAGRQTASILHTLGRPQWVADDAAAFLRIAQACAADAPARAAWRTGLRREMAATTLADGRAYAAELAVLLRRLASG